MASLLLQLPYELRQRIFECALRQLGTIGLQYPPWTERDVFVQPLFQVSRASRDEALEAFIKTNNWLWIVEPGSSARSDPAEYPILANEDHSSPLTPCLPWLYPHLWKHLRCLHVNIHLPADRDTEGWADLFPQGLANLIRTLDHGRRLSELHLSLISKCHLARFPLARDHRKALDTLSQMRVRGKVRATLRNFKDVRGRNLSLERRMRA